MKRTIVILSCILLLLVIVAVIVSLPLEKDYGEFVLLSTPIGELHFTERWEKYMLTEELPVSDGYAVNVSAKTKKGTVLLYELYIGTETSDGFRIGYVNDMEIRLDLPDVELDSRWKQADIDVLYAIQEDLNTIIDQIVEMDGFYAEGVSSVLPEEEFGEYVLLNTPAGDIHFTERWKNHIVVSEVDMDEGYAVEISAETDSGSAGLCILYMGPGEMSGSLIGYVNGMAVWINESEIVPGSGWTDADINMVYSMQEDLSCVVDQVMEMEGFHEEESQSAVTENFGEYALLSTPVGELYFTERWKGAVITEEIPVSEGYAVSISAQTASGAVKLYELHIGVDAGVGILLGYVDGIGIWLDVPDVELDTGWTEADTDTVYAIQEDLDCIVDQIVELDGFASA